MGAEVRPVLHEYSVGISRLAGSVRILMEEILTKSIEYDEPAGSIVRVIDGVTYTVLLHFNPSSKESPKDKIMRMIRNGIRAECLAK